MTIYINNPPCNNPDEVKNKTRWMTKVGYHFEVIFKVPLDAADVLLALNDRDPEDPVQLEHERTWWCGVN